MVVGNSLGVNDMVDGMVNHMVNVSLRHFFEVATTGLTNPTLIPIISQMVDNVDELEWRCSECGATAPPTGYDYMRILRHQKGHHVRLVNKSSGEILASSPKEARSKGIELLGGKPETPGEAMELTEEGITFPITLPPVVFTMFDAAKAAKFVDEKENIDTWLFQCVQKRFELDYGLKLMLVPVGEKKVAS